MRIMRVNGIMKGSNIEFARFKPSTALRTEIAGVITPSPYNNAAPNNPSTITAEDLKLLPEVVGLIKAMSANIPPSPSLSALMTMSKYLIVMTIISDQNTKDNTPYTLAIDASIACSP